MAHIFRGQANEIDKLNFFIQLDGNLFSASEVGFRILNINAGAPGVQLFPVVDGTYEDATSPPGRFAEGSYFAYDNALGAGWTPSATQELGDYRIEWRWKDTPASSYQAKLEDFTIVAASIGGAQPSYIDSAYVRSLGLSADPPTDQQITASISVWQTFIDRATRSWFLPRTLNLEVDGNGSSVLQFGVPIISIQSLEINLNMDGTGQTLAERDYRVYNAITYPADKQNPRIKLIDSYRGGRDIYTSSSSNYRMAFHKGEQNQKITGVFGHIDESGSTPDLIKYALGKLVIEKLSTPPAGAAPMTGMPPLVAGAIVEERTDGHQIKYQSAPFTSKGTGLTGITKDQEILDIIKLFRAPIGIATQNDSTYR